MTISWSDYKIESSTSLTQSSLSSFGGKLYSALPLLQLDVTEEVLSVKVLAVLGAALARPDDEGPPPPALAVPGVVMGQVVHVVHVESHQELALSTVKAKGNMRALDIVPRDYLGDQVIDILDYDR